MRRAALVAALALAVLAWAAWEWRERTPPKPQRPQPKLVPSQFPRDRGADPSGKELAPAAEADEPNPLRTPGHLPPIAAPIAEPLADAPPSAPIALLKAGGTLNPSAGRAAAEVLWQALQRCGATATAPIDAEFALIAGLEVGQSGLFELQVHGVPADVAACLQKSKPDLRAPIVSDTGGTVQVRFGPQAL